MKAIIDISVVLNIHREALWLRPTLLSLEACASQARNAGLKIELVAVFDRSDEATKHVFIETDLTAFEQIKTIDVDVGSLGLARNAGITQAEGEFIWTADADDLVSANALTACHRIACSHPYEKIVVFVDFLVAFGDTFHVTRYFASDLLTAADFVFQHSYISRIFLHRSVFKELSYLDLRLSKGFAYEDWHFNCCLFERGFSFKIAPDTIIFYRQRTGSLLKQANRTSAQIIPHTPLFAPQRFRENMINTRRQHPDWTVFMRIRQGLFERNFTQELLSCALLRQYVLDAASLDPEVAPQEIEASPSGCPLPWDPDHWGFHLERWYELLGNTQFSDVVLLPWLKPGGGEKYILNILDQLQTLDSTRKILVVSGEPAQQHEWINRLPPGSVFLDLYNSFPMLDDQSRMAMLMRSLLAATSQGVYLHLKASILTHSMMERYGAVLGEHFRIIYYRFSDANYIWHGMILQHGGMTEFIRCHLDKLTMVICDCKAIVRRDAQIIAVTGANKYNVIYTRCTTAQVKKKITKNPTRRLLWASRVTAEKRPELLLPIVMSLRANFPDLCIEIFGTLGTEMLQDKLFSVPGLTYCGIFDGFDTLPLERYDAFIYTSAFDGLPNVILEAMAAGLPVIAPDIGGIAEVITNRETGFLLANTVDDTALIAAYTDAVCSLYSDWEHTQTIAKNGQELVAGRHNEHAFSQRVQEVFALNPQRGVA